MKIISVTFTFLYLVVMATGEWEMVFRASTGVDYVILDAWNKKGGINEADKSIQTTSASPAGLYRSSLIDNWQKENIAQVKISFYSGGNEVSYLTFEAFKTTYIDWFSKSRVLYSTYTDIFTAPAVTFSIEGNRKTTSSRRFNAHNLYNGCEGDKAWFMVIDKNVLGKHCAFDAKTTKPYFLYCPSTNACLLDSETQLADVMVIYIARGPYHTGPALVGMWYFTKYTGGRDLSGNGNDAKVSGVSYVSGPKGEVNGGVQFSGSASSYIEIPNNGKLDVVRSYTLMMQVKTLGDPDGPLFSYESHSTFYNGFWELGGTNNFHVDIFHRNSHSSKGISKVGNILRTNQWDVIAVTYDYEVGKMKIYRDGSLFHTQNYTQADSGTQFKVRVAARPNDGRVLKADVSCYQLYNYALTAEELSTYKYRCQDSVPFSMPPSLLGMWYFSRMYGGKDLSGHGNDAKLYDVTYAYGPQDEAYGAVQLSGNCSSYIEIPNNGMLDVVNSFTLMMQLYTQADTDGPLFNYVSHDKYYLLFWELANTKSFRWHIRDRSAQTITHKNTDIFRTNQWDLVTVTYDYSSGMIRLYRGEAEMTNQTIGQVDLGTQHLVRIGASLSNETRCLKVRLTCYQLYNYAMTTTDQKKYRYRCQDKIGVTNRWFTKQFGEFKELIGQKMTSEIVRSDLECASLCTMAEGCLSYNYADRTGQCTLNSRQANTSYELVDSKDKNYFQGTSFY